MGFVEVDWNAAMVRIEYRLIAADRSTSPLVVFLHEGLGSVLMWRDFPDALCAAAGVRGLVYSRPGYGKSSPRLPNEHWKPDYLERQASDLLPKLLRALGIEEVPWLFGHSDGASIALLYAMEFRPAGVVVLAPHLFVEELSTASIQAARDAYVSGELRSGLARHHDNVDSAFWGWNDVWLSDAFRQWNRVAELSKIACPVLAIQGMNDEYGSMEQIRVIARMVPNTTLLELDNCAHSPHRDQRDRVIAVCAEFLNR